MTLILIALTLGSVASLVALIYPVSPFRTRGQAARTLLFCLCGMIAASFLNQPSSTEDPRNSSNTNATSGLGSPSADTSKGPALSNHTAKAPSQKPTAPFVAETTEEHIPRAPYPEESAHLLSLIRDQLWEAAETQIRTLASQNVDLKELKEAAEQRALSIVKPLPASDHAGNLAGYRFLEFLKPDTLEYSAKVQTYAAAAKAAREAVVAKLRRTHDKIEGVTWLQHPNQPRYANSRSTVYLYLGRRGEQSPWLRMKVQYAASRWLFVERVHAWHDGNKVTLYSGRFERDNHSTIWEWVDVTPSAYQIEILRSLATAKEAVLRFEGDRYHRDVTIGRGDKQAILDVLSAYEVLTGSGRTD